MITKMIKQGVLSEITILICDAQNDRKFSWPGSHRKCFFVIIRLADKPEVIHEAYKFTIHDSCKPIDQSKSGTPDDSTIMAGRQRSSTFLINQSSQVKRMRIDDKKSRVKERNIQMQNMIGEVFEKMNEFAKKRDVSILYTLKLWTDSKKSTAIIIFFRAYLQQIILFWRLFSLFETATNWTRLVFKWFLLVRSMAP